MNIAERLAEMWHALDDEGRLDRMDDYFADDYVRHSDEGEMTRDQFRSALSDLQAAFPDLAATVSNVVVDGARAAYAWAATGTHTSPYMGAPPTKRQITATGITISRFAEDGRIAEDWASWNKAGVLHRLGIIPIDFDDNPIGYRKDRA